MERIFMQAGATKLERHLTELERAQISARIKQARLEAGLTQEELADLLHVRQRTVANYEANRVPWRLLDQIAEATAKTRYWLLHGDDVGVVSPQELSELRADVADLRALVEEQLAFLHERLGGRDEPRPPSGRP